MLAKPLSPCVTLAGLLSPLDPCVSLLIFTKDNELYVPTHDLIVLRDAAAGFNVVFPLEKLHMLNPMELGSILCGDQAPSWTKEDILNYTEPKLGYTRERSVTTTTIQGVDD